MTKQYVIATIKPWNIRNFARSFGKKKNFHLITKKEGLTSEKLRKINPRYIFFPHWSWMIPAEIWSKYECVVMHETDLPYGRGGSPIQNLVVRGHTKTKISAIRVGAGFDTGFVYVKRNLSLKGTAQEIFERASKTVFSDIIPFMIRKEPKPRPQRGKAVVFKRRKPEEGDLAHAKTLHEVYDLIRMLDAEEYPKAFLETKGLKVEFSRARFKNGKLEATVEIFKK